MDQVKLPHNCVTFQENGYWILRWSEDSIGVHVSGHEYSCKTVRICPAAGPEGLTERDARQLARKYLLSQLQPGAQIRRSETRISEFVEKHFVPEFVAIKTLAARAHYYSMLKHVLTPEEADRIFQVDVGNSHSQLKAYPDWPFLGSMRLRDVRPDHVQRLISAASGRGYSSQTIKHIRSVVSAIFLYAKQASYFMGDNPARSARLPETVGKSTLVLTLAQTKQVLRAMRYPEKEMTIIALLTDMNVSEICGLQWKHANLTGAWSYTDGEPIPPISIAVRKQWYRGELSSVKDARRRTIKVPEVLLPTLLLLSGRTKFTGPEDFVLTSRSGGAVNVTNITARRLSSIGRKLQMPGLSWQVFRRAHAAMKEAFGPEFQYQLAGAVAPESPRGAAPTKRNSQASQNGSPPALPGGSRSVTVPGA